MEEKKENQQAIVLLPLTNIGCIDNIKNHALNVFDSLQLLQYRLSTAELIFELIEQNDLVKHLFNDIEWFGEQMSQSEETTNINEIQVRLGIISNMENLIDFRMDMDQIHIIWKAFAGQSATQEQTEEIFRFFNLNKYTKFGDVTDENGEMIENSKMHSFFTEKMIPLMHVLIKTRGIGSITEQIYDIFEEIINYLYPENKVILNEMTDVCELLWQIIVNCQNGEVYDAAHFLLIQRLNGNMHFLRKVLDELTVSLESNKLGICSRLLKILKHIIISSEIPYQSKLINDDSPHQLSDNAKIVLSDMFYRYASNTDGTMNEMDMRWYILSCGADRSSASESRRKWILSQHGGAMGGYEYKVIYKYLSPYTTAEELKAAITSPGLHNHSLEGNITDCFTYQVHDKLVGSVTFDNLNDVSFEIAMQARWINEREVEIGYFKSCLPLHGFWKFYKAAIDDRPYFVWSDLMLHGYHYDLTKYEQHKYNEEIDGTLPRYYLSVHEFDRLFSFLLQKIDNDNNNNDSDGLVEQMRANIWQIICRLPLNLKMKENLLNFENMLDRFDNLYLLVYNLLIISSIINMENTVERQKWKERFLLNRGFDKLIRALFTLLYNKKIIESQIDDQNENGNFGYSSPSTDAPCQLGASILIGILKKFCKNVVEISEFINAVLNHIAWFDVELLTKMMAIEKNNLFHYVRNAPPASNTEYIRMFQPRIHEIYIEPLIFGFVDECNQRTEQFPMDVMNLIVAFLF